MTYKVREALPAELPVLTNTENLPLTFTSSNDAIAAVAEDGTVTLSNEVAGTAIVTAAFAGSETYDATSVSFTVEVLSNKVDANVADPNLVEGQIAVDNIWKASAELRRRHHLRGRQRHHLQPLPRQSLRRQEKLPRPGIWQRNPGSL